MQAMTKKKPFTSFLNGLLALSKVAKMLYPTKISNFRKNIMVSYSVILTAGLVWCLANAELYGGMILQVCG